MKAVYPGERGSFAELAAIEYFGSDCRIEQVASFEDVFTAVKHDPEVRGVIPIENTRGGSVHRNYDLFIEKHCYIVGELYLRIGHCLIANRGVSRRRIKRVLSHPQALAQCRKYLKRYRSLQPVETVNTAVAVKTIKDQGATDTAAIASMQAAIDFDMEILEENIQDDQTNTTRFLVLSRSPLKTAPPSSAMKSSIVFSMEDSPGSLFRSLAVFSLRDIDLFKIESRPTFGEGFNYLFYLDFEGDSTSEAQKNALNHLREKTTFFRFLGSYPIGRRVAPQYTSRNGI
jgi:prephenate dehydratase